MCMYILRQFDVGQSRPPSPPMGKRVKHMHKFSNSVNILKSSVHDLGRLLGTDLGDDVGETRTSFAQFLMAPNA